MSIFTDGYFESSDGLRLFYRDFNSQSDSGLDPVLCLPGLTRNSRDFDELAALLSKKRRVITTDLRGRGRSDFDPNRSHYHPTQYVADTWQLLEQLEVARLVVIGTSLGGLMVMLMALERPAAMSAAIMNDIGPEIDPAGIARIVSGAGTLPLVPDWDQAVAQVKKAYAPAFPNWPESKWLEHTHKTYARRDDGSFDIRLDRNVGVAAREGVSGVRQDPWQLFEALLPIPLLVIRGASSDILSIETVQKMQRRKPDMKSLTVQNRGHAPNLDEPEVLNAINSFLKNL